MITEFLSIVGVVSSIYMANSTSTMQQEEQLVSSVQYDLVISNANLTGESLIDNIVFDETEGYIHFENNLFYQGINTTGNKNFRLHSKIIVKKMFFYNGEI